MKKLASLLSGFLFAITGTTFSADITITGETWVNSHSNFTYYATPPTPIVPGTTYTWEVYDATIIAQNTDPNAGPLYCTVRFPAILSQSAIDIADNQGNSGRLFIIINGFTSLTHPFSMIGAGSSTTQKDMPNTIQEKYTYIISEAINPFTRNRAIKKITEIA